MNGVTKSPTVCSADVLRPCPTCCAPFPLSAEQARSLASGREVYCSRACWYRRRGVDVDGQKTCSACREAKPTTEFCRQTRGTDGFVPDCRDCRGARRRRWRQTDAGKLSYRQERARYRERHREAVRLAHRIWLASRPGYSATASAKYRVAARGRGALPEQALSRSYVAKALGLRAAELTPELHELYRAHIFVQRLIKDLEH